jgi:protein involved in polysaccharide export with SLBB domain
LYETLPSDTVKKLLQMAGGISAQGYRRSASISRYAVGKAYRSRVHLNLEDEADLSKKLFDGDFLEIDRVKEEIRSQVLLRGSVARPGGYAWREGLRISDIVSDIDDDLLDETDVNTGLVIRRSGIGLEVDVLGLNLLQAINQPGSTGDLALQAQDEVLIFSLPYFNDSYNELRGDREDSADVATKGEDDQFIGQNGLRMQGFDGDSFVAGDQAKEEREGEEKEDRQDLVEEVVFRLQAQAKTPSETNLVAVAGDVRLPGTYPLLEGGEIAELIELAGGFEASAYLDRAEVTRLEFEANGTAKLTTIVIPLAEILEGVSNFKLEPRDQIQIRRIPNWSYGDMVELTGAIVSPGEYPIAPGETLSSILSRAGGLNRVAFPEGAILVKTSAKKREQEQVRKLVASFQRNEISRRRTRENEASNSVAPAEISSREELFELLLDDEVGGRVVIDLSAILAGDSSADIELQAGDSLFVPEFSNTVSVIGEVREPGTFSFQEGRSISDYIEYAAGASTRALVKETYVVRANGGVQKLGGERKLFKFDSTRDRGVRPGDTIVIPVNEDYQPSLTKYREVSTVVFNSLASLFPLFRL